MVSHIMDKSNCYSKRITIIARLLQGALNQDPNSIGEPLTAKDIQTARIAQFMISIRHLKPSIKVDLICEQRYSVRERTIGGSIYVGIVGYWRVTSSCTGISIS